MSPGGLAPTLSTHSNPDHLKRISYSEVALNKAPPGSILVQDDLHFPGFNPVSSAIITNPRTMSRSHHNLGQMPESPVHRVVLHSPLNRAAGSQGASHFQQHQRASSDSNSLLLQQEKWVHGVELQNKVQIYAEVWNMRDFKTFSQVFGNDRLIRHQIKKKLLFYAFSMFKLVLLTQDRLKLGEVKWGLCSWPLFLPNTRDAHPSPPSNYPSGIRCADQLVFVFLL